MATSCIKILSIIIIIIIIIIITISVNTIFKMGTPFPGPLKAQQNVNFARFTTHVLLPISQRSPGYYNNNNNNNNKLYLHDYNCVVTVLQKL